MVQDPWQLGSRRGNHYWFHWLLSQLHDTLAVWCLIISLIITVLFSQHLYIQLVVELGGVWGAPLCGVRHVSGLPVSQASLVASGMSFQGVWGIKTPTVPPACDSLRTIYFWASLHIPVFQLLCTCILTCLWAPPVHTTQPSTHLFHKTSTCWTDILLWGARYPSGHK